MRDSGAINRPTPSQADRIVAIRAICGSTLASLTAKRQLIAEQVPSDWRATSLEQVEGALLDLRAILAELHDFETTRIQTQHAALDESEYEKAIADFRDSARKFPPKQSWFEEDVSGLRGPGR